MLMMFRMVSQPIFHHTTICDSVRGKLYPSPSKGNKSGLSLTQIYLKPDGTIYLGVVFFHSDVATVCTMESAYSALHALDNIANAVFPFSSVSVIFCLTIAGPGVLILPA